MIIDTDKILYNILCEIKAMRVEIAELKKTQEKPESKVETPKVEVKPKAKPRPKSKSKGGAK